MQIGSRIKPRSGISRTVTIHGRPYTFKPATDKLGEQHFVADVHDQAHAEILLGTGDFYAYGKDFVPEPRVKQPVAPPPQASSEEVEKPILAFPQDVMLAAEQLLNGSASAISAEVGKVSSLAVVKAALATEQASAKPRRSVVALLEQTLAGAAAAGVAE